jgi:hypothetical protein
MKMALRCSRSASRAPVLRGGRLPQPRTQCAAGMGIGFLSEQQDELMLSGDDISVPKSAFGLSPSQMMAMGIAGDAIERLQRNLPEVRFPARNHSVTQNCPAIWRAYCIVLRTCMLR